MMISVIIPTLNERARLPGLLRALERNAAPYEIIITDGGSNDGTPDIAATAGVRLVTGARGRGAQLALGAKAAGGNILFFLHADSQIADGTLAAIRAALADQDIVGGNFRLVFDGEGGDAFARWLTGFYAWFRQYGVFYGDSGMFMRRTIYEEIGGFRPMALMEDFDLRGRLLKAGKAVCIAEPALVTSSRRFRGRHPVMIFIGWLMVHALYYLRTPPDWMARLYDSKRRRTGG